jgi:hypothetical protein
VRETILRLLEIPAPGGLVVSAQVGRRLVVADPIRPRQDRLAGRRLSLSYAIEALRAARAMLAEGGTALVVDERVNSAFAAPNPEERLFYSCSVLFCLPTGMSD